MIHPLYCILKSEQHRHHKIEENWSNLRRIKTTVKKPNALIARRLETGDQNRIEEALTEARLLSLEEHAISHFERRWLVGTNESDWRSSAYDKTLINRGMQNILAIRN